MAKSRRGRKRVGEEKVERKKRGGERRARDGEKNKRVGEKRMREEKSGVHFGRRRLCLAHLRAKLEPEERPSRGH